MSDAIYNVVVNVSHFQYDNSLIDSLYDIPFMLFLFLQLVFWMKILLINQKSNKNASNWYYVPYLLISLLLFTLFMFAIKWKIKYFSVIGLYQSIDTLLEVVGFSLATICLARANSTLLRQMSIGYLLIITSDFIIRYHVISGSVPYLNTFEMVWILGLSLIWLSLPAVKSDSDQFMLLPINSLQSIIAVWLLMLWLVSALMFGVVSYFLSANIENESIAKNFLSMLVPFSVFAIVCSGFISVKISAPLERLKTIINNFLYPQHQIKISQIKDENSIDEFNSLESFIFNSFEISQEKNKLEVEFANTASQVAHDIRSPLAVLRIIANKMVDVADTERQIIYQAVDQINEIVDGLLVQRRGITSVKVKNNCSLKKVYNLIANVLREKKIQYKDRKIDFILNADDSNENIDCQINELDFMRVMSNLINNAVEAISDSGSVIINLKSKDDAVEIAITDTGCGMPDNIINNIERGISYNKPDGNGLGLKHAINCIREWGGEYGINSQINIGTTFFMKW